MNFNKQKILKDSEEIHNRKPDCSINNASKEIMLHRISEGKEIEFPFSSINQK